MSEAIRLSMSDVVISAGILRGVTLLAGIRIEYFVPSVADLSLI